ncbi:hypothetical protein MTR_6g087960 [Medicago truncatula]|uniref:Uncharacterized protein n=1 Tax=Medicago truncatula TaxID=3880 RepID=G7KPF9_MEDTR|nr:hypothetical protein MTR_6g087960 [Medicago truncatula]
MLASLETMIIKAIYYQFLLLKITKTSLNTQSFIFEARFQKTLKFFVYIDLCSLLQTNSHFYIS